MMTRSRAKPGSGSSQSDNKFTPSSASVELPSSTGSTKCPVANNNYSTSKMTSVSWLQVLLGPILTRRTLGSDSNLKHDVSLDGEVLSSAPSSLLSKTGKALGDQIKLLISYADTTLSWTFKFVWLDPSLPPFMNFSDNHFMPAYEQFREFFEWDPTLRDCFLNLVERLFLEYRKTQLKLVESSRRLAFDLESLRSQGYADDQFDVYTYQDGARKGDVVFIFPVRVPSVANLPAKLVADAKTADDYARLKIKYSAFGQGKAQADLELTPFLNKLFNGKSLTLPPMECFIWEYVQEVQSILEAQVTSISDEYQLKRNLTAALVATFPQYDLASQTSISPYTFLFSRGSVIDYSVDEFTGISFKLEHQEFQYVLKIIFPKFSGNGCSGQLVYSSAYHEEKENRLSSQKPTYSQITMTAALNIPSAVAEPRASVEEIAEKIQELVDVHVEKFKKKCSEHGI